MVDDDDLAEEQVEGSTEENRSKAETNQVSFQVKQVPSLLPVMGLQEKVVEAERIPMLENAPRVSRNLKN